MEPAAPADSGLLPLQGNGQHVLYIDDDDIMIAMVDALLQRAGFRVTTCQDAALALQFQRCQATQTCRDRFGDDLRGQLRTLMTRLAAAPVSTEYRDPSTGELVTGEVTAGTVAGITRMYSYFPQGTALLPLGLNEAQQGRYGSFMSLSKLRETQDGYQVMNGLQLSVR